MYVCMNDLGYEPGFTSNKPIHYLLDYGDLIRIRNHKQIKGIVHTACDFLSVFKLGLLFCLSLDLNYGFSSNNSTNYILDYSDFSFNYVVQNFVIRIGIFGKSLFLKNYFLRMGQSLSHSVTIYELWSKNNRYFQISWVTYVWFSHFFLLLCW